MSEQPSSLSTRGRRAVVGMEERDALRAEVAALAARVARLEGALTTIATGALPLTYLGLMDRAEVMQAAARAALAGTDGDE